MRKLTITLSLAAALVSVASCKKSDDSKKSEESAKAGEAASAVAGAAAAAAPSAAAADGLLAYLPGGAQVVFGGNYKNFMDYWTTSPLKGFSETMMKGMGNAGSGMSDYMSCWVEIGSAVELVGSLETAASGGAMRMVFSGLGGKALSTCAEKGGFKTKAEGKFLEITGVPDGMGGEASVAYYLIDDNTTYFYQDMPFGGDTPAKTTAAMLEADMKKASESSAAKDAAMQAMLAKADRSKAFWFSGSAAGTPIADKVGEGNGWIGVDKTSLSIGFSIDILEEGMAAQAVAGFGMAESQLGMLDGMGPQGKELKVLAKQFLDDAKLSNEGNQLTGQFKITNELLEKALPMAQAAMGGMMGGM